MKVTISNRSTGMKMISITPQVARVTGFASSRANKVTPAAPGGQAKRALPFKTLIAAKITLPFFPIRYDDSNRPI